MVVDAVWPFHVAVTENDSTLPTPHLRRHGRRPATVLDALGIDRAHVDRVDWLRSMILDFLGA